jgi:hypothetical protein
MKHNLLDQITHRILGSLPEFIGCDMTKGTFNEFKTFYPNTQSWYANPNTLKCHELVHLYHQLVEKMKHDPHFNDNHKWLSHRSPPSTLYDYSTDCPNIRYPYIQKIIVSSSSKLLHVGDIHGSSHSFLRTLIRWNLKGKMDRNFKLSENYHVIITGDYVDYGNGGIETWWLLITLKLCNWNRVFMTRGNHELWDSSNIITHSSYINELIVKFGVHRTEQLKPLIKCVYNLLPHALLIGTETNFFVFAHGGLDPTFHTEDLYNSKAYYQQLSAEHNYYYGQVPSSHGTWSQNYFIGRLYNNDPTTHPIETDLHALKKHYKGKKITTHSIIRGHQHGNSAPAFCFVHVDYPVGTNPNTTLLPSWQAPNNVSKHVKHQLIEGRYNMLNRKYYPLYTSFTATGNTTRYDCYGQISMYSLTFKIVQHSLDTNQTYLRSYAKFVINHHKQLHTIY